MKLTVLALDYDGTIATGEGVADEVRAALGAVRASGITVLLVTGRILSELRRVAGDLYFVDGVVAENGAIVHFPSSDHTSVLAPPVPPALLDELGRRDIPFRSGQCLVDTDADHSRRVVEAIRALELPLVQAFNRGRVMILPQGVSKATGLQVALDILRLSARNTLAIGDAENDHELLRLAEVGAAVEWGSRALQAAADVVVPGAGPGAVAPFLAEVARTRVLPQTRRARRRLHLGYGEDGSDFSLAVRGRNVLVAGDARSGKSWVAGLLCEQLILHGYSVCVLDPEGDYRSLEALRGVSVLGGEDRPPPPHHVLRELRFPDRSLVVDLSQLSLEEKVTYVRTVLPALNETRRRTGLPHRILIDEAHYFLHDPDVAGLLDFEHNGYTVVTYRASRLPPEVLAHAEVMIVTCESTPGEVDALARACAHCSEIDLATWRGRLGHLPLGEAVALPVTEEAGGLIRHFNLGRRLTPHVRHRAKYMDVPVADRFAFEFAATNRRPSRRVRTMRAFVEELELAATVEMEPYLRRGDFSRWVGEVFGDYPLARDLHRLESRVGGLADGEIAEAMAAAVRARYDLVPDEHGRATGSREP